MYGPTFWLMMLAFLIVYGLNFSGFRHILKGNNTLPKDSLIGYGFSLLLGGLWLLGIVGTTLFPNSNTLTPAQNHLLGIANAVGFNFLIIGILFTLGLYKKVIVIRS